MAEVDQGGCAGLLIEGAGVDDQHLVGVAPGRCPAVACNLWHRTHKLNITIGITF